MTAKRKLTDKQQKFADHYIASGNASDSARQAGYSASYANTHVYKLLENARVRSYIEERNAQLESDRIASMKEVKEFWTNTMRDECAEYKDRLKASEHIAKTNGAFLDKVEHSGEIHNTVVTLTPEEREKRIAELKAKLK